MGKINLDYTIFSRRDPVTGNPQTLIRQGNAMQSSEKLKSFRRCVADKMRGASASGNTGAERAASIRDQFREAAKQCGE